MVSPSIKKKAEAIDYIRMTHEELHTCSNGPRPSASVNTSDVDLELLERHRGWKKRRNAAIRPERKYLTDFHNPIEYLSNELFVERYGLTKNGVLTFMEFIAEDLSNSSGRGQPLPPLLKFLVVLRFYAAGSFQEVAGELEHVSQPTVSRLVKNISDLIARKKGTFISYPIGKIAESEVTSFNEKLGFPDAVGVIDCTHIKIQSPGGITSTMFKNKEGYSCLNVQATCNSNMQFTNIVARWGGSIPDSVIFAKSTLRENYENGTFQGSLLGDSNYGCCEYLMTPIPAPSNLSEERYNNALQSARIFIRKTFMLWKKVFPCLSSGFRIHVSTTMAVIVATAVLYNFGRQNRLG